MEKTKIVIDTNVILSGLLSNQGNSFKILQKIADTIFEVAISVPLILEYEAILKKQLNRTIFSDDDINDFINFICKIGAPTKIFYLWRPILNDPYDDHILEVAVASQSQYIVTFNKKDFKEIQKFGIIALSPKEYLQVIGG